MNNSFYPHYISDFPTWTSIRKELPTTLGWNLGVDSEMVGTKAKSLIDPSLWWGAVPCFRGLQPVLPDFAKCPLGAKSPEVENH